MAKVKQEVGSIFTNSPLVNYTRISPNHSDGRIVPMGWANRWEGEIIDTITIHCVVGQTSVETLGNIFANPNRKASSNYGIGYDGQIGMYVEEKDRSWCSGGEKNCNGMTGSMNDYRAITIEVASDTEPPYAVTTEAYEAIIRLCVDICQRNGIKRLKWLADPAKVWDKEEQNMTAHRWFAYVSCPGDYLYDRFGDIAEKVNEIIDPQPVPPEPPKPKKVDEDGSWGPKTSLALQQIFGCPIQDGVISGQPSGNRKYLPAVYAAEDSWQFRFWRWQQTGSDLIYAMQLMLANAGYYYDLLDRFCGKNTVKAIQMWLRDQGYYFGEIDGSCGPQTVTALQRWINAQ